MRRRHSRYEARMYDYEKKRYGPMMFMWDMFMFLITGGFWLIWIFVREMRR
jgi:hypothetical protein